MKTLIFITVIFVITACASQWAPLTTDDLRTRQLKTPLTMGDTPATDSSAVASPDTKSAASKQKASDYQKDLAQCQYEAAAATPPGRSLNTWAMISDVFAEQVRMNQLVNMCLSAQGHSLR